MRAAQQKPPELVLRCEVGRRAARRPTLLAANGDRMTQTQLDPFFAGVVRRVIDAGFSIEEQQIRRLAGSLVAGDPLFAWPDQVRRIAHCTSTVSIETSSSTLNPT